MFRQSLLQWILAPLLGALMLALSLRVTAGVAIVVNPSVTTTATAFQVASLFLGRSSALGGVKLKPIDQEDGSRVRDAFYQSAAHKSPSQLNAYWARLIFTGKGRPPKAVFDDDEVKALIQKDTKAIGYIDSTSVDDSVKVVLTLD